MYIRSSMDGFNLRFILNDNLRSSPQSPPPPSRARATVNYYNHGLRHRTCESSDFRWQTTARTWCPLPCSSGGQPQWSSYHHKIRGTRMANRSACYETCSCKDKCSCSTTICLPQRGVGRQTKDSVRIHHNGENGWCHFAKHY